MPTEPQPADTSLSQPAGLDAQALGRLSASIQADIEANKLFGASIIVARRGVVGYRDLIGTVAPGRPAAADDKYLLMSLSKSFTAALILRAIDQGRFTLDTYAADILPAFGAGGKQRVTLRQLLTHTGGTYNGFLPPAPYPAAQMGELAKMAEAVSAQPAANTPGERVVYNTFGGYAILGQILVATDPAKRSFQTIVQEDLFAPLGMHDTSYGLAVDAPRRVPVAFTEETPANQMMTKLLNTVFTEHTEIPAGSAFGTADDVFKFAETLRLQGTRDGYRLLSQALFQYGNQNHTGSMSNGAWDFYREAHHLPDFPANFSLLGGYVRGTGHFMTGAGLTASPRTFYAVGGGTSMWLVDPERELTFIFLSAGYYDGLAHFQRLQRLSDLALAACVD